MHQQQQQPNSREMQSPNSHNNNAHDNHFDPNVSNEDFIEQMLNTIPSSSSWPDLTINNNKNNHLSDDTALHYDHHDQSAILASKLRQHQISNGGDTSAAAKMMLMQQQMLMMPRSAGLGDSNNNMLHMPLGLNGHNQGGGDNTVQALFNGLSASLQGSAAQHFNHPQSFSAATSPTGSTMNQSQASGSTTTGAPQQPRQQRVRARRGQATDPHSIAERLRRERIAERMKSLQELVPNANKTDKASMLDEIIDYVKFLQLQVKVLSMSRLGGAGAVAPLVADMSSEGNGGDCIQPSANAGSLSGSRSVNGNNQAAPSNNDNLSMTEHQVAKLMEEDMGQAMQYLQGKGLCLMPISLATAISTSTAARNRNNLMIHSNGGADGPTSPNMSVMTDQSASMANGGGGDGPVKDATSVSKS